MKHFSCCFMKGTVIFMCFGLCSCDSSTPKKEALEQSQIRTISEPSNNSNTSYYPVQAAADTIRNIEPLQLPDPERIKVEETPHPAPMPRTSKVTISKYYERGYDKGYDDGEDDAVMGNGWYEQFDDSNPYKGKNRKDYEEGYEEGYEAGYYDNNADDD